MLSRVVRIVSRRAFRSNIPLLMATAPPKLVLKDKDRPLRVERDLPNPYKDRNRRRVEFLGFSVAIIAALALIFNYEKTESPIVSNTLYHLRRSPAITDLLGENIEFDGIMPWVFGELNQVAGKVNIKFYIKGSKGVSGVVKLVAGREARQDEFLIQEWSLTTKDKKIDLLSENEIRTL